MANLDNSCSHLEIDNHFKERLNGTNIDTLGDILEMQKNIQETVYGYSFDNITLRELKEFWHMNEHAMVDEMHEAFDALGGINDGIGSAVWKKWKKNHSKIDEMKISSLSENDKKELYMELVDMLHFFMNYCASVGMSSETMYNYYISKNTENKNRQNRGY